MTENTKLSDERIGELYRESFNAMIGRLREAPKHLPDTVIAFARAIEAEVAASRATDAPAQGEAETWLRARYGAYRGHPAWRELEEAFNAGQSTAQGEQKPVAWAVVSKKGGIHKLAITRDSAERKAEAWQEEWPNNGCTVRPLVFGDVAPAASQVASIPTEVVDALKAVRECGNGGAKLSRRASDLVRAALAKMEGRGNG